MPVAPEERALLAESLGFADYAALMAKLDAHREIVEEQFDEIFANKVNGQGGCGVAEDSAASWVWSSALADDSAGEELHRAPRRTRFHRSGRLARAPDERLEFVALRRLAREKPRALRHRRAARAGSGAVDRAARAARRHDHASLRPARSGEPARRLSRVADRISGGAGSRAVGARRLALGGGLPDPASATARRTARRRSHREPVRLAGIQAVAACAHRRRRWRRAADGPAASRASG